MWRNSFCNLEWADTRSLWLKELRLVGVLTLVHTLAFLGLTKPINWGIGYLNRLHTIWRRIAYSFN